MKMNVKVFNSLTSEPKVTQNINGETLGIYHMEDTPFHNQFLSKGRMSAWLSDGKTYKLLVDEGFFNASGRFFDETVNGFWIDLLNKAGKINSKYSKFLLYPALLVMLVVAIVVSLIWQDQSTVVLVVAVLGLFVVQIIQTRLVNKEFEKLQSETQSKIYEYLGEEEVALIVSKQEAYMQEYYKIDETTEETQENDPEVIEADFVESEHVEEKTDHHQDEVK